MSTEVVVVPQTCPHCKKPFEVHCKKSNGVRQMDFYRFACPHCKQTIHELLPDDIVAVIADRRP